ncbi:hypothetical protein T484DRAFT_1770073, partial [Baffinella frigidus]
REGGGEEADEDGLVEYREDAASTACIVEEGRAGGVFYDGWCERGATAGTHGDSWCNAEGGGAARGGVSSLGPSLRPRGVPGDGGLALAERALAQVELAKDASLVPSLSPLGGLADGAVALAVLSRALAQVEVLAAQRDSLLDSREAPPRCIPSADCIKLGSSWNTVSAKI